MQSNRPGPSWQITPSASADRSRRGRSAPVADPALKVFFALVLVVMLSILVLSGIGSVAIAWALLTS